MQSLPAPRVSPRPPLHARRYHRTGRRRGAPTLEGIRPRVDTRNKILTPAAALALTPPRPLVIVKGYFDLLRAEHVRSLDEIRRRTSAATLLAVVLPLDHSVLALAARAELVAALRMVDYVLLGDCEDLDRLVYFLGQIGGGHLFNPVNFAA